jgi:glyoxylase-like metal-dependent hydrolase (beta-lactamase superfamily II)
MSPPTSDAERLRHWDVVCVRAPNPGPLTMSGTNSWVVGRDPAWVVDPGPALAEHLENLATVLVRRGGLGGIVLTHDHIDHSEAVVALRESFPAPLAAGRNLQGTPEGGIPKGHAAAGGAEDVRLTLDIQLSDDVRVGPFEAVYTPGHAPDHFALVVGGVCFTGDAVLGEGSVFVAPDPGALAGYLVGLEHLAERDLDVLCPGHGPPIWTPRERIAQYIEHRLERERLLLAALSDGCRSTEELLDAAWSDVPEQLRPLAAVTLAAHLDKLEEEERLPAGVERAC